jgi:hypothetical protein
MSDISTPSQTNQFAGYWLGADGQWNLVDAGGPPVGYGRASDGNWYPSGRSSVAAPGQVGPPQATSTSQATRVVLIVVLVFLALAVFAVVCIAAITLLGNNASTKFSQVGGSIGSFSGGP